MSNRPKSNTVLRLTAVIAVCVAASLVAQEVYANMSSSNFKMQNDSVNFGGDRSTSTSYSENDTLGEIATGISSSTNYTVSAGFQQPVNVYISITAANDVVMSPALGGLTGGTSTGATSFIVTTDNPAGYFATIQASSSPALRSAFDSFADYVPLGSAPDFSYRNSSASSTFAFSVEGTDIASGFKDNGSACGTGSNDTADACWDGLSTTPKTFLSRGSSNQPSGTSITLKFKAAIGQTRIQMDGAYVATSTVTIIPL